MSVLMLGISLGRESLLLCGASGGSGLVLPLAEVTPKVMIVGCPMI
jgi:hypothetical protein